MEKSLIGLLIALGVILLGLTRLEVKEVPKWLISVMIFAIGMLKGWKSHTLKMVIAQAKVESDNYSSELAERCNNIFGMRPSKKRKVHYNSISNNYACYTSFFHSILDYYDLAEYNDMPKGLEGVDNFALFLKNRGYYEAPLTGYVTALKSRM